MSLLNPKTISEFYFLRMPERRKEDGVVAQVSQARNISIGEHPAAPNDNFRKNICSEDDLRSRIFGTFVVKFLACLPLLGFSDI